MSRLNFTLEREAPGSQARAARFQTLHGEVQTPIFMPVGTLATVKGQTIHTLSDGMIASGMERGVNDGYEKLDDLLGEQSGAHSSAA